jgi:hypothetical protein
MSIRIYVVFGISLSAAGCIHASDAEIKNPISQRAVEPNHIVKEHGYAEQARGLPPGALSDEAALTVADPGQLCFAVTMRELDPIDLRDVEVALSAPKKEAITNAQMWPEPTRYQTFEGLVPERRETGVETVCSSHDANGVCVAWQTRPIYATVYVRGPVNVYQARGRLCFANGVLTPATEQVSLDLRVRKQSSADVATVGLWGPGVGGTKRAVFRWGFSGAGK